MDISIKNVPEDKVARLKARAKRNHRSLQGELLALIDEAVSATPRKLSVQEVARKIGALGLTRRHEAATLIREDRDR
jgi:plasmid stability protein